MMLQQCCHALDTQEAQQRATPSVPSALETRLSSLANKVATLRGAQGRGRAPAAPHAAALEPVARAPHAASPYPRPAAPGTKPARKPWRPKSERRSQAQNSAAVADDPTDTVNAASLNACARSWVAAAASHALRQGRSPVSLLAADADAALAANLNLPGTAVAVSFDDNVTVLSPGASAAAAAQRRSPRRAAVPDELRSPGPRPLFPKSCLLQAQFPLSLLSLPKELSAKGFLSDLTGGTPVTNSEGVIGTRKTPSSHFAHKRNLAAYYSTSTQHIHVSDSYGFELCCAMKLCVSV
jgi:hypothetical protein